MFKIISIMNVILSERREHYVIPSEVRSTERPGIPSKYPMALIIIFLLYNFLALAKTTISNGEDIGITIVGAITNPQKTASVALIKELDSGQVKAVKAGFSLLNKYLVTDINFKYIVLKSPDTEYVIYQNKFAREFLSTKPTPSNQQQALADSYKEEGFERQKNLIKMTDQYRDHLIKSELSKILMQATALPNFADGAMQGFKLTQIDQGSIFDKAGFQDEDIITSINNHELNSVGGAISLLNALKGEHQVEVQFKRNGQEQTIKISVQ